MTRQIKPGKKPFVQIKISMGHYSKNLSRATISSDPPTRRVVYLLHCTNSISECALDIITPAIINIHLTVCNDTPALLVLWLFPYKRQVSVGKQHFPSAYSIQAQALADLSL